MNRLPIQSRFLMATIAIAAGLLASTLGSRPEGFGEPTIVSSPPQSRVRVNLSNPNEYQGTLFRIEKNKSVLVARLAEKPKQCFDLPSGSYKIALANGSSLAVPAFAEHTSGLLIQTNLAPQPRSGWCWIPQGPAIVGDTIGIGSEDERPVRIVNLPGFWLGQKEVTNAQYTRFLSEQPSPDERWIDLRSRKCRIQKTASAYQSDAPDLPVVMVSLSGAQTYCDWLSKRTGKSCRLPTEEEWEKAARGPESFVYAYGNVYQQKLANQESGLLKDVGTYLPNSYGLFDMTGNAFEWMSNQYDPQTPHRKMNQSLRGGSFVLDGMYLRNSFRMRQSPSVMTDDIGFRVLMEQANDTNQSNGKLQP